MGHEVICFQESEATASDIRTAFVNPGGAKMFFWVHTHSWKTEGIEDLLFILKEYRIPTVGYHLDLWLAIEREKDLKTDPYWQIEYFFSVDPKMVDLLNSDESKPKAFFLPAGVFEDECYTGEKKPEFSHDVIFVGSRGYHKEWPYREKLISWLEKTYGNRFAQYGGGGKGTIRGKDLNDLYASAKVVVGDTLCKDFNYPYYLSDRIFETTGRGGFIIHPYISGIEDLFNCGGSLPLSVITSGRGSFQPEIITYTFNDFEYLKYAIDYYLHNEDEREAIRNAGHLKTKECHTYTNRLNYLIEIIQNERK